MKKMAVIFLLFVCSFQYTQAQEPMEYFLPQDVTYNPNIPTPENYFQQQLGEWHLSYYQVLSYLQHIAAISERAIIEEYARSHENHPLVHIIFTSGQNQNRLDELKELHLKFSDPGEDIPMDKAPLVVTLAYGVHGNESSATNSSLLTSYYLAAAQGEKIDKLLENTIILVDPCMNPDGFTRHSTWANSYQSITDVSSPDSQQFNEVWPGNRTNHYWFDLNRDYLLLVHPESRGRVAKFHEWKPNIFTDHHEMSANSTFFFQPGIPSRNNPLTPDENYRLTYEMAQYHARFLDATGSHYYMEESFDDYYLGKGSTYPDLNGSIGILFEQAGFRGRIRETTNGVKKFAFGIRNQFTVSLSTLEAAMELRDELMQFQKDFYREALQLAKKDAVQAYVFGDENNLETTLMFVDLLNRHQVRVYRNEEKITINNITFMPGSSFAVPVTQPQYRFIKSIFEVITTFTDSTFYDVSTWTLPYAFNLPCEILTSMRGIQLSGEPVVEAVKPEGTVNGGRSRIGYLFRWNEYSSPSALYSLQKEDLLTKVATDEFSMRINGQKEAFTYGTILIPVDGQNKNENEIFQLMIKVAKENGIDFFALDTGLSEKGIHIGSGSFVTLQKPEVIMLVGSGTTSRDAGEIWHLFDQRHQIPVTLVNNGSVGSIDLNRYNTLIMPPGSFRDLSSNASDKIKQWTEQGGTLVAIKNASTWASRNSMGKAAYKKSVPTDTALQLNYANRNKEQVLQAIGGAIFNAVIDITHPLCYGYLRDEVAVFKTGNTVAEPLNSRQSEPVKFSENPYISGYVSEQNLARLKNSPVVTIESAGRGKVINYHESMAFRGIWIGTNKLFMNSIFFGNIVQ